MIIPDLDEYNEQELVFMLNRYELLPKRKKDFGDLLGVRVTRKDFEQFKNLALCSPQVMAFAANYFQNQDQIKEGYSKNLFFAQLFINFAQKDDFRYYKENLMEKQFNPNTVIDLIIFVHREAKLGSRIKSMWQMPIFRIPDKITQVFVNQIPEFVDDKEEDEQWYQLTRCVDGVFHIDFYSFKHFYQLTYKNYSNRSDGGLEIMWYLYKFLNFVEPEKVEKIDYPRKEFHKQVVWLMLKLKFLQEDPDFEPPVFIPRPIEYKQKLRHFNGDYSIKKIKEFTEEAIQTEFSIHPRLNFDFGRFGSNEKVYVERDKKDSQTQTGGIGFEFNQQIEYTLKARDPNTRELKTGGAFQPNTRETFKKLPRMKQKKVVNKPTFSLTDHINPLYKNQEAFYDYKDFERKIEEGKVPPAKMNMGYYCQFLLSLEKNNFQNEDISKMKSVGTQSTTNIHSYKTLGTTQKTKTSQQDLKQYY